MPGPLLLHDVSGDAGSSTYRLVPQPPAASLFPMPPLTWVQESLDSPIDRRSDFYRRSALLQQFQQVCMAGWPADFMNWRAG